MSKHSIILRRKGVHGCLSDQTIGTDAFNAMASIPGVTNPKIIKESDQQVEITYNWTGEEKLWQTGEHFLKFGLARADVQKRHAPETGPCARRVQQVPPRVR